MADQADSRDEWRVEVELGDPDEGLSLSERLRAHDLDDQARERLSDRVIVTRDGSKIFLYAGDERAAREAERVMRELVAAAELEVRIAVLRWHPVEEAWREASVPLPRSEEERVEEEERRLAAERREVAEEGDFDWEVRAELESRAAAAEVAHRLEREGWDVTRRWRYLIVGALTEETGRKLADRVVAQSPGSATARVEPRLSEPTDPLFVFLESR